MIHFTRQKFPHLLHGSGSNFLVAPTKSSPMHGVVFNTVCLIPVIQVTFKQLPMLLLISNTRRFPWSMLSYVSRFSGFNLGIWSNSEESGRNLYQILKTWSKLENLKTLNKNK